MIEDQNGSNGHAPTGAVAAPIPNLRSTLLSDLPLKIGAGWAEGWREEMVKQGRPIAGGWPGTIGEARARVAAYFENELRRRKLAHLTSDELAAATRAAFGQARRDWLAAQLVARRRAARRPSTKQH
jgi:hypothetical protein